MILGPNDPRAMRHDDPRVIARGSVADIGNGRLDDILAPLAEQLTACLICGALTTDIGVCVDCLARHEADKRVDDEQEDET